MVQVLVDVLMLAVAVVAFELLLPSSATPPADRFGWFVFFSVLVLFLFWRGLYAPRIRLQLLDDMPALASATAAAAMAAISLRVLLGGDAHTTWTVRYWLFATGCLVAGRTVLHLSQSRAYRRGDGVRPTLIVGAGRMGHLVARRLLDRPQLGLRPIGFLDKEPLEIEGEPTLPVLGASWDLDRVISERGVEHVIVTFSTAPHHVLLALARRCRERGVPVSLLPRLFEIGGKRVASEHLGGLPLVAVEPTDPRGLQFSLKYLLDRVVAAIALLVALPLLAAISLAVRLTMGGPVFYSQTRVGLDGREFEMLKFRTMKGRPEESGEADFDWALEQTGFEGFDESLLASNGDGRPLDRCTALGRFLRRFSLDELPQFLNVLRGEMSIVGPRPERAGYAHRFEQVIDRYGDRHRVKSGITGWAQVNGLRGKTSLADRVEWDNFYVENWSLWLDVKIVLMTAMAVLRGEKMRNG